MALSKADQEQVRRRGIESDLALNEKQRMQVDLELQDLRNQHQTELDRVRKEMQIVSAAGCRMAKDCHTTPHNNIPTPYSLYMTAF